MNLKKGLFALSPLVVFLVVYLLSSIIAGDFYKVPVCSAFLISCVYAVLTTKGKLSQRLEIFSKGAGHPNILLMIWMLPWTLRIRNQQDLSLSPSISIFIQSFTCSTNINKVSYTSKLLSLGSL